MRSGAACDLVCRVHPLSLSCQWECQQHRTTRAVPLHGEVDVHVRCRPPLGLHRSRKEGVSTLYFRWTQRSIAQFFRLRPRNLVVAVFAIHVWPSSVNVTESRESVDRSFKQKAEKQCKQSVDFSSFPIPNNFSTLSLSWLDQFVSSQTSPLSSSGAKFWLEVGKSQTQKFQLWEFPPHQLIPKVSTLWPTHGRFFHTFQSLKSMVIILKCCTLTQTINNRYNINALVMLNVVGQYLANVGLTCFQTFKLSHHFRRERNSVSVSSVSECVEYESSNK